MQARTESRLVAEEVWVNGKHLAVGAVKFDMEAALPAGISPCASRMYRCYLCIFDEKISGLVTNEFILCTCLHMPRITVA